VTVLETRTPVPDRTAIRIEWSPVIAGAIAAAAVALVLHGFAVAIGLAVSSAAPTWRDTSFALVLLSGLFLLLAAVLSYGFGGYVAGRLRSRISLGDDDLSFSDGMHGLITWGVATLLTAFLALAIGTASSRLAAPAGNPATSVAGENLIAFDIDRLFRGPRPIQGDVNITRAEAARILLSASSHRGMLPEDRAHLVRLVAANTGLAPGEADRRVTEVSTAAKENIERARRTGAILAFIAAAAAAAGAAVSWFAAESAGRHRDGLDPVPALLDWGNEGPRRSVP
jgi:hypothetical protein